MSQEKEQGQSMLKRWKERLRDTYRLVLLNNETFEEVGSYQLNLLNVYILFSTIVVLVAMVVWLAIAFTPLRKYIPGYGDASNESQLLDLYAQVESLEKELENQRTYSENFRKVLVGDVETEKDVPEVESITPDSLEEIKPSEEAEQLRQEIAIEEIGAIAQRNRTTNLSPRDIPLEQMYFTPPLTGEISAGFMPDIKHFGVDILAPKNTAVKAAMDGYVFLSDWTLETGNTIGIQHSNNTITFYKHNSVLLKKAGSYVKAGEAVAIIGNTGTLSSGPHLHFELWNRGKPIDPTDYISF